jgi:hypothetical protein
MASSTSYRGPENSGPSPSSSEIRPFEEQHYPIRHWARCWGFSTKTVREWFRDEYGPGILRLENSGRRLKRDYTTLRVSPRAAARVYSQRTMSHLIH